MNRNAGLRYGLFSVPIKQRAVPEAGAPVRPVHGPDAREKRRGGFL